MATGFSYTAMPLQHLAIRSLSSATRTLAKRTDRNWEGVITMRYSKIDRRIWADEKFRRLSDSGKLLLFYLISTPHANAIPGTFRAGEAMIAEELGWTLEQYAIPYTELLTNGILRVDSEAHLMWLPNAIRYNLPDNSNVIMGWAKSWDELPECQLKHEVWSKLRATIQAYVGMSDVDKSQWVSIFDTTCPEPYAKRYTEPHITPHTKPSAKPLTNRSPTVVNQEQEQEQEQEQYFPLASARSKNRPPASSASDKNQLIQAAQFVTQELNLAGRDMYRLVENVIALELSQSTETPQVIAEMLVRCRRSYDAAPHKGNFVWPVKQFFEQGIWKHSRAWREKVNENNRAEERLRQNAADIQTIIEQRENENSRPAITDHAGDAPTHQSVEAGKATNAKRVDSNC